MWGGNADGVENSSGEFPEVSERGLHRLLMGADRSVRRSEKKHGSASLLPHWNEAVVVLNEPEAVRVILYTRKVLGVSDVENVTAVDAGDLLQPAVVCTDHTVQTHTVLQDYVTAGVHCSRGNVKTGRGERSPNFPLGPPGP